MARSRRISRNFYPRNLVLTTGWFGIHAIFFLAWHTYVRGGWWLACQAATHLVLPVYGRVIVVYAVVVLYSGLEAFIVRAHTVSHAASLLLPLK